MTAALFQNGQALRFASARCQADWDLVALALENDPQALRFAAAERLGQTVSVQDEDV